MMTKQLHWACTARGAHKCEKCHLPFQQGHHFSISWSPGDCDILPSLKNQTALLLHYMIHVMISENMVYVLCVTGGMGHQSPLPVTTAALAIQVLKLKRYASILLEPFRA